MLTLVELCVNFLVKNQDLIYEDKLPQELIIKLYDRIGTQFLFDIKVIKNLDYIIDRVEKVKIINDDILYDSIYIVNLMRFEEDLKEVNPFVDKNYMNIIEYLINNMARKYHNSPNIIVDSFTQAVRLMEPIINGKYIFEISKEQKDKLLIVIDIKMKEFRHIGMRFNSDYDNLYHRIFGKKII